MRRSLLASFALVLMAAALPAQAANELVGRDVGTELARAAILGELDARAAQLPPDQLVALAAALRSARSLEELAVLADAVDGALSGPDENESERGLRPASEAIQAFRAEELSTRSLGRGLGEALARGVWMPSLDGNRSR